MKASKITATVCAAALAMSMGAGAAFAAGSYTSDTMPSHVSKGDIVNIANGAKYKAVGKDKVNYNTPKSTTITTAIIRAKANGITVVGISSSAFKNCSALKTVKVKTTKVSAKAVKKAVKGTKVKTIKVKKSMVKAYKKAFKGTGISIKAL